MPTSLKMGWDQEGSREDGGSDVGDGEAGIESAIEVEPFDSANTRDASPSVRVEGLDLSDRDGLLVLHFPGDNVFAAPHIYIPQLGLIGEGRVQQAMGLIFNAIRLAKMRASGPAMREMFEKSREP